MIADTVEDRAVHIGRIHQFDMGFQTVLITDIAGMDDKSSFLISRVITNVGYPITMIVGVEYLCISDMHIFMTTVRFDTTAVRLQSEVVRDLVAIDTVIMLIVCFIARRGGNKNEAFPFMSRQGKRTVASRLHDIETIGNENTCHSFLAFIKYSIVVFIDKDMPSVGCIGKRSDAVQQGDAQDCFLHVINVFI